MRAYPLVFIVNTPMYDTEYRKKHGIKTKKILIPNDLLITRKQYVNNPHRISNCDFSDKLMYEETEVMYECNSFTNNEFIEMLKRWWWYHNFYNLGTIRKEISKMHKNGFNIVKQIDKFFELVKQQQMPTLERILNTYENAIREIYKPEPITEVRSAHAVHFFEKGMRTYETAFFIDNKHQVKLELEKIYGHVDTDHWKNRYAVTLDEKIYDQN